MIECRCCQGTPEFPSYVPLWTEYRVGSLDSPERFYLCPRCDRDEAVDPTRLWVKGAKVHRIR